MQKILLLILCMSAIAASAQKIEGIVYDDAGNVLPYSSVLVKGSTEGAVANNQGLYNFNLPAGNYTLICQHVGYTTQEKAVTLAATNLLVNFSLTLQKLVLKEVVIKRGEDPAYDIIRHAIKKRAFYDKQVKAYEAEIYIKGVIRLRNLPDKVFGKKIPDADRKDMALDSSGKGIVYLSESVTKVSMQQPGNKVKLEVISGRESGSNGFGFNFPAIISFYDNNVNMFQSRLNPRGFVSPIADGALNYYKYKFLGSFFEDGKEVNTIRVIPKRSYEPLFSGIINITEDDWRMYNCDLVLTKTSQLEVLDTLEISQIHAPVNDSAWRIKSQVLHFNFKRLGIDAVGDFVNVYSRYNLQPDFAKKFFNNVIIKYDTSVNKKPTSYWDSIRPVPLELAEVQDYHTKDSMFIIRDSISKNLDTLRKRQGNLKVTQLLWSGVNRTHYSHTNQYTYEIDPLLQTLQYNTVEGAVLNPSFTITKPFNKNNTNVSFITDVRYGFNNNHFNLWSGLRFRTRDFETDKKLKRQSWYVAGGKRVSQFSKESSLDGLSNSITTLFYGRNYLKIYENYFAKAGFSRRFESGTRFLIEGEYEDRIPLNNTTDFVINDKYANRFTPNYPVELLSSQFVRHQAVLLHGQFSFKPGQKYIEFPDQKIGIGSSYPTFTIDYTKGFKNIFGSDVDYDKWSLTVTDNVNLKLAGSVKYKLVTGGFLNKNSVFVQDYKNFYGNQSHVFEKYVETFQTASYYAFSNTSSFYAELHFEHHFNGLLTNKIPLLKKWGWNFVDGTNALYVNPNTRYAEIFAGFENIFKVLRIDAIMSLRNGYKPEFSYRFGFDGLLGSSLNSRRLSRERKVIDKW